MKIIREAVQIIREYRKPYLVLNFVFYGLTVCAMIFVAFCPIVQETLTRIVLNSFNHGVFAKVVEAYKSGKVMQATVITFLANLIGGSFFSLTFPSLFIPFSGMVLGCIRAIFWGLLLSPTNHRLQMVMIPHSLTLILEGQGYILALLGVYIQGKLFLHPKSIGMESHWDGYKAGLRYSRKLYISVIVILAIAALYESVEGVLMMKYYPNLFLFNAG